MKLIELEPRWIHPNVFVFRCPCHPGCQYWLSCKDVAMNTSEQTELFIEHVGKRGFPTICTKGDCAWSISSRDFETMSVLPSLDFSAARHWHGSITAGAIK